METPNLQYVIDKFNYLCYLKDDINEHLPILFKYASECESIIELGVRGCVSSWALVYGLLINNKNKKSILLNDKKSCDIQELLNSINLINNSLSQKLVVNYEWKNDLDLDINENVDLTFIDTWHVYGQLKRELNKFSKVTNKYIIMHDTTIDAIQGETIRNDWDAKQQSIDTGIPVDEINNGLWPAIIEFLQENVNWTLYQHFSNNNGLTILKKI